MIPEDAGGRWALPGFGRGVASLAGAALVAATVVWSPWRRFDGSLRPETWTLVMAEMSLLLVIVTLGTGWARCGRFTALGLFGQACALGLIDAPRFGVFQHYWPWGTLLQTPRGLLLFGPALQTVVVAVSLWQTRLAVRSSLAGALTRLQAMVLAAAMVFCAAYGSWDVARYLGEVALAVWVMLSNGANVVLIAAAVPGEVLRRAAAWLDARLGSSTDGSGRPTWAARLFPLMVAASVVLASGYLAAVVLQGIPHITDEIGYLFQAKHFSVGRLYLPAPPAREAFAYEKLVIDGARWWSSGFPGWPLVLALGVRAGVPWLVNPLLGGLAVLLVHRLVARLYGPWLAHCVAALMAASPWFLFMSASHMTHPLTLVLALVSLLALEKAREGSVVGWGLVAGASIGGLALTRPLEAVLMTVALGPRALGFGAARLPVPGLAAVAVAGAVVGGLIFPYNFMVTGDPLYAPHQKWADAKWYPGADRLGFGSDVGNLGWSHLDPFPGHGFRDIVINANQNLSMLNVDLFGWAMGSLLFAVLGTCRRWSREDWLFGGIALAVIGGHSFYWHGGGPDFGARYWYQCLVPAVVFTARGVAMVQQRWEAIGGTATGRLRIAAIVVAASFVAVLNFMPWRSLGKYHNYRDLRADVARLAGEVPFGHSVVFVRGGADEKDYASAMIWNPPTLDSPGVIYVRDPGADGRAEVMRYFPGRPGWVIEPVEPGGRFRLVSGPLLPVSR